MCEGECALVFVILGLDPRIHKDKSIVLVSLWIAGSHPQGDVKGNDLRGRWSGGRTQRVALSCQRCAPETAADVRPRSVCTVPRRPRCYGGIYDRGSALKKKHCHSECNEESSL